MTSLRRMPDEDQSSPRLIAPMMNVAAADRVSVTTKTRT
jgi:hypothetical protein